MLPPGITLSTRHFLMRRDIMFENDVINIQHAHCGLVGPDCKIVRCLQRVFLRGKPKPVCECEPRCLSLHGGRQRRAASALLQKRCHPLNRKYVAYHYASRLKSQSERQRTEIKRRKYVRGVASPGTERSASPEEDRAPATGNMHKKCGEDSTCSLVPGTDKHIHADTLL